MIIKRLRIESFGKLRNLDIVLHNGLNVIYGENEAGKSTLQTFIKSMFYGMNGQRKKIRENDRKRFLPWSGEKASGELYFEDDYKNVYVVKRSFGERKREDDGVVLDVITGKKAAHIDQEKPGIDVLGLGEEAFENTVFVKQLMCQVVSNKDDEIIQHLSNLQQSGDENISYHKAMDHLQRMKKQLCTQRKTGKLDKLKERAIQLQEEWQQGQRLHEENREDQIKLNEQIKEKAALEKKILHLEEQKKRGKLRKLQEEYRKLEEYENQIKDLTHKYQKLVEALTIEDEVIDENFVEAVKEGKLTWMQQKKQWAAMENDSIQLENRIKEKKDLLEEFQGYEELDEDTEIKLHHWINEKNNLAQKLQEAQEVQETRLDLEKQLSNERDRLGKWRKFEAVDEKIENEIYSLEEELKRLKHVLNQDGKREHLLLKKDFLQDQLKRSHFIGMINGIIFIGGCIGGWLRYDVLYILSIVGLAGLIYAIRKGKKITVECKNIEKQIIEHGDTEDMKSAIEHIRNRLNEHYASLEINGYEAFRTGLRKYTEQRDQINGLKVKIEEKQKQLAKMEVSALQEKYEEISKSIAAILAQCHCLGIEDFMAGWRKYKTLCLEKANLEKDLSRIQENLKIQQNILRDIEKGLIFMLKPLNAQKIQVEQVDHVIIQLESKLKEKMTLEHQLASCKDTYRTLRQGRDIENMKKAIEEDMDIQESEVDDVEEEDIEEGLKSAHQRLITLEKQIKDTEYRIQRRFYQRKTICETEEEIQRLQEAIQSYEEISASLDIATEGIQEAFKEIQKNFGPRLNRAVGDILSTITYNKYNTLKISEDYEIKMIDPVGDKIKEIDYFSNGTWDQIYFALRMGIITLIGDNEHPLPLILDDAFIQYDDSRLRAVLDYLYAYAQTHQVILFTCQKREVDVLKEYKGVHFHTLASC